MLQNGTKAPEFSLQDANGKTTNLSDAAGKPVVLIFVRGQFCPTTDRFLTAWQDFYNRIKDLGMELFTISADTVDIGAEITKRLRLSLPVLSDPDLAISKQYGIYEVQRQNGQSFGEPALVIIDKDGEVAYSIITSGPKGLPDPGAIAPVLIYMNTHDGKY